MRRKRWAPSRQLARRPGRRPGRVAGADAPDHGIDAEEPLVIDLDATLVTAHSDKEQAAADVQTWVRVSPVVRVRRPRPGRHR